MPDGQWGSGLSGFILMKELLKILFFKYQRCMWYLSQGSGEVGKPTKIFSESAMILLILGYFGIKLTPTQSIVSYIIIALLLIIFGKVLSVTGVVEYNNKISNKHNSEITKIVTVVDEQDKKITEILKLLKKGK